MVGVPLQCPVAEVDQCQRWWQWCFNIKLGLGFDGGSVDGEEFQYIEVFGDGQRTGHGQVVEGGAQSRLKTIRPMCVNLAILTWPFSLIVISNMGFVQVTSQKNVVGMTIIYKWRSRLKVINIDSLNTTSFILFLRMCLVT
jgi:hypothetical protein